MNNLEIGSEDIKQEDEAEGSKLMMHLYDDKEMMLRKKE
jgi:hypothetical protein